MNKSVIVTGGTSGIGLAAAKCFLDNGDNVVIAGRNKEKGDAALKEIGAPEGKAYAFACDTTDEAAVKALVDFAVEKFGKLDVMVTAAGAARAVKIHEEDAEGWNHIISTDLTSVFYCNRDAIQAFQKQGNGGAIVNVSSIAGLCGMTSSHGYSAAKAAVANMTKSLGVTYAKEGIRVNAVAPGYVKTPLIAGLPEERVKSMEALHPIGRFAEPSEIGEVIYFLASEKASFITGVVVPVDGGYSII
ncbi:MAG: SDR family oxidoreductase [Eubacteriaceae bacterium]|nr:SDR family oxidoreductase [Eubacteriaceae bacterium]